MSVFPVSRTAYRGSVCVGVTVALSLSACAQRPDGVVYRCADDGGCPSPLQRCERIASVGY
jgi:hypothetical protein